MATAAEYHALLAAKMTEKALDGHVRRLLRDLDLWEFAFHAPDGVGRFQAGLPDWIIHGPRGCLYRELKTVKGRLTDKQEAYIARVRSNGIDAGVWRPPDLFDRTIVTELIAIADPKFGGYHDELAAYRDRRDAAPAGRTRRRRAA